MDDLLFLLQHFDWAGAILPGYRSYVWTSIVAGILLQSYWIRGVLRLSWSASLRVATMAGILLACADPFLVPLAARGWMALIGNQVNAVLGADSSRGVSDLKHLLGTILTYGLIRALLERGCLAPLTHNAQRKWTNLGSLWVVNTLTVTAGLLGVFAWFYPMKGV